MNSSSEHQFLSVFQTLRIVEDLIESSNLFIFNELGWEDVTLDLPSILYKPAKVTILHHFIFQALLHTDTYKFHKNDDLYEEDYLRDGYENSKLARLDADFYRYSINLLPFQQFANELKIDENTPEGFVRNWFDSQYESFIELWEKKTDDAFYFIFSNRTLLIRFGLLLSEYIKKELIPRQLLRPYTTKKSKIKRIVFPNWVKRAVFYRDRGQCVYCDKDLSGLLHTMPDKHFDHMVSLNEYGTNDPTNVQLTCSECNLRKSGKPPIISPRYWDWWPNE